MNASTADLAQQLQETIMSLQQTRAAADDNMDQFFLLTMGIVIYRKKIRFSLIFKNSYPFLNSVIYVFFFSYRVSLHYTVRRHPKL